MSEQKLNEALQRLCDMASGEHPDLPDAYHTLSRAISDLTYFEGRMRDLYFERQMLACIIGTLGACLVAVFGLYFFGELTPTTAYICIGLYSAITALQVLYWEWAKRRDKRGEGAHKRKES